MGIELDVTNDSWGVGSKEWLKNRKGLDTCRSITVDISLFNALHYPNGYIPSGILLGKVTATGLYGPYSPLLANGLDVNAGHLLNDVMVRDSGGNAFTKSASALFWEGIVDTTKLPTFTGAASAIGVLDANGRTDVAAFIRYEP